MSEIENLPDGWTWTTIGDMCNLINGMAFKSKDWASEGLPIIRIQNLNNHDSVFNYCDFEVDSKYYVNDGDLLFAWSGTPGTSFGAHIWNRGSAVLNQHIFNVKISESYLDKRFVMHIMNLNVQEYVRQAHGTAGLAHITKRKFEDSPIFLPPLAEQHRIVAKIEELFTRLDAGVESLKTLKKQIKRYRQSVLKAAVEGKLTKAWREAHQDELEPASVLLEHITEERKQALGKKYKEPEPVDTTELPQLPEGWAWARVSEACEVVSGQTPAGIYHIQSGDVPFFKVSDMNLPGNETIMMESSVALDIEAIKSMKMKIQPSGTIVFPKRGGAIATNKKRILGKPAAYDLNIMGIISEHICRKYLFNWISSIDLASLSDGSNVPQINHKDIDPLFLPVPSAREQDLIAKETDRLLSLAAQTEKSIDHSLKQAERLRQSILKRAFEGKLVPQDPNDEPASVLLERIKAEKAAHTPVKKTRKKKSAVPTTDESDQMELL
jgi:type I restriction enzyme, S subunit